MLIDEAEKPANGQNAEEPASGDRPGRRRGAAARSTRRHARRGRRACRSTPRRATTPALPTEGLPLADGVTAVAVLRHGRFGGRRATCCAPLYPRTARRARRGRTGRRCSGAGRVRTRSSSCSSYSGNTAETLALLPRGAGARVPDRADHLGRRSSPTSRRSSGIAIGARPRRLSCRARRSGYLAFALLGALEPVGLLPSARRRRATTPIGVLEPLVDALGARRPLERNEAKALASRIGDRQPVDLGRRGHRLGRRRALEDADERERQGARLGSALPELDHNEVVGWPRPRRRLVRDRAAPRGGAPRRLGAVPALARDRPRGGRGDRGGLGDGPSRARAASCSLVDHGRLHELLRRARARGRPDADRRDRAAEGFLARRRPRERRGVCPAPATSSPQRAAAVVRAETDLVPRAGVVLGSGLGPALGDASRGGGELRVHRSARVPAVGGAGPRGAGSCSAISPACRSRRSSGGCTSTRVTAWTCRRCCHDSRELGADTMVLTAAVGGLVPGRPRAPS